MEESIEETTGASSKTFHTPTLFRTLTQTESPTIVPTEMTTNHAMFSPAGKLVQDPLVEVATLLSSTSATTDVRTSVDNVILIVVTFVSSDILMFCFAFLFAIKGNERRQPEQSSPEDTMEVPDMGGEGNGGCLDSISLDPADNILRWLSC